MQNQRVSKTSDARDSDHRATNAQASEVFAGVLTRRTFGIIGESFLALGLAIALNSWLDNADPFGIKGDFPWIWLIPAVFTLRYGTFTGIAQTFMLVLAWFGFIRIFGTINQTFPQQFFLGGLVLCLVLGQFSDVFRSRNLKTKEANGYLEDRLMSLTRTHFLLRLSHQRLEQELLIKPVTLRDSLDAILPLTQDNDGMLTQTEALLGLLAQNCEIESATLFGADAQGLQPQPIGHIGEPTGLVLSDPVVARALLEKELVHVRSEQASLFDSKYLVVAPIVSSQGSMLGALVVTSMPFLALNSENLQLMAVMLGFYADGLHASQSIRPIKLLLPACPNDFALELVRTKRLYDAARIESSLLAFRIPEGPMAATLMEFLQRARRQSDFSWDLNSAQGLVHIVLMPLAGHATVEGFLNRLEEDLRNRFQLDFGTAKIATHFRAIDRVEVAWALDDLLNLCKLNTQPPAIPEVLQQALPGEATH